jgi:small GTP-binding protein
MTGVRVKVCLLGDKAVGKTSTIKRFVYKVFDDRYISTVGTNVEKKQVIIGPNAVSLMVWDILGEEGFDTLRSAYYSGAKGGIFVCDVTNKNSLDSIDKWVKALFAVSGEIPVIIFCNKWDLKSRAINLEEVKLVADRYNAPYLTTSAKTGESVDKGFHMLAQSILAGMRIY